MQRGWTVAPVWVTSADERVLDEFRDRCHETIRAHDPSLAEAYDHTSAARVERNEERRMGLERDLHRERSFDRWDRER